MDHSNYSNCSSYISNNSNSLVNLSNYENKLENSFRSIWTFIKDKIDSGKEYNLVQNRRSDISKNFLKNNSNLSNISIIILYNLFLIIKFINFTLIIKNCIK